MRTIQITVAVGDETRYVTTDEDGCVTEWAPNGLQKPVAVKPDLSPRGYWLAYGATPLRVIETHIPCPTWRESLVELKPENDAALASTDKPKEDVR